MNIEIVKHNGSTKYLGRMVNFADIHGSEVDNRISAAWRKFSMLKQELTSKFYPLKDRIRLFYGTVTPTVLYGSGCWTLTKDLDNRLRRCQRRMMRMIIGCQRRRKEAPSSTQAMVEEDTDTEDNSADVESACSSLDPRLADAAHDEGDEDDDLEPWPDFIRRATRETEAKLQALHLEDWVTLQRKAVMKVAIRVLEQNTDRWSQKSAFWEPMLTDPIVSYRSPGRPRKRWNENLDMFAQTTFGLQDWQHLLAIDIDIDKEELQQKFAKFDFN